MSPRRRLVVLRIIRITTLALVAIVAQRAFFVLGKMDNASASLLAVLSIAVAVAVMNGDQD